jgi:hypothetical protein
MTAFLYALLLDYLAPLIIGLALVAVLATLVDAILFRKD